MQIKANALVSTLSPLQYGVPNSPTLRQSECVIFQEGKAYTFSGDLFAIVDCDLGFTGAVPYKPFFEVLQKYGEDDVSIDVAETTATVKRGRSRTKLPYYSDILLSIQAVDTPDPACWSPLPASFTQAIQACEAVARVTRTDTVLSSLHFTGQDIEAASPAQIVRYKCPLAITERFLVRAGILGRLVSSGVGEYQVSDKWLFLRSDKVTFAVPIYKDDFIPNLDSYLQPTQWLFEFPKELLADMPLIGVILGRDGLLKVQLENDVCTLIADGSRGNHTVSIDMGTPCNITFKISVALFNRILSDFPCCTISDSGIRVNNAEFSYAASVE